MGKYLLKRFIELFITLFIIATITFFLTNAAPGNPLEERAMNLPDEVRENMYKAYGLDKSLGERYVITMTGLLKGNFGPFAISCG